MESSGVFSVPFLFGKQQQTLPEPPVLFWVWIGDEPNWFSRCEIQERPHGHSHISIHSNQKLQLRLYTSSNKSTPFFLKKLVSNKKLHQYNIGIINSYISHFFCNISHPAHRFHTDVGTRFCLLKFQINLALGTSLSTEIKWRNIN